MQATTSRRGSNGGVVFLQFFPSLTPMLFVRPRSSAVAVASAFDEVNASASPSAAQHEGQVPRRRSAHESVNLFDLFHHFLSVNMMMPAVFPPSSVGPPPTSPDFLTQLPVEHFNKDANPSTSSCSICLDDFEDQVAIWRLPCGHTFHVDCARTWLEKHNVCPNCRVELPRSTDVSTSMPSPNQNVDPMAFRMFEVQQTQPPLEEVQREETGNVEEDPMDLLDEIDDLEIDNMVGREDALMDEAMKEFMDEQVATSGEVEPEAEPS